MHRLIVFLLLIPAFAGCLNADDEAPEAPAPDGVREADPCAGCDEPMQSPPPEPGNDEGDGGEPTAQARPPATYADGRFAVDVPVPVILVGFPSGTAAELHGLLPELRPDQRTYNNARLLSPTFLNSGATTRPNPMDPTADYQYHDAPAIRAAIDAALPDLTIADGLLDANAMDDLIQQQIDALSLPVTADTPGIVLLHLGSNDHAYRLTYPTGYIENVRAFGERNPYTVLDVSARVDPYVGSSRSFNQPIAAEGAAETLAEAVRVATWYRTLQGPLYPQSVDPCHAVTLMVVYRASTLSQTLPGYSRAEDLLDQEYLLAAWESLLGEGRVHVDPLFIALPVDDPPLEAILREGSNEALRAYMDENWDAYHVDHDGCQAYLSVFLIGDAADSGVSGIAMYDINDQRRISMSWMNDLTQFNEEDGAAGPIFYSDDPSRDRTDWVNFLFSHETGHLFGQRHPHDVSASGAPSAGMSFAAIWSSMSYQQDGKMPLFGAVDTNNYWRNRAGFIGEAAGEAGLVDDPVFAEALQLMGNNEWQEAGDALQAALAA